MTTTITSTKEVGAGGYTLTDFTSKISGTIAKVGATDVVGDSAVRIADGVIDGADRVLDMTSNEGRLDRLIIQRIKATNLRRGIARLRDAGEVLVEDVYATGANPPGDYYPTGVATSDIMAGTMILRRCHFKDFIGKTASYTNGDGVATEELVTSLLEDVYVEDNADGGLDLKGKTVVRRGRGSRNHRNFRFWGDVDATDLTSEDPRNAHIWVGGGSRFKGGRIERPTFIGGSSKPHLKIDSNTPEVTLTIVDPVVPEGETFRVEKEGGSKVKVEIVYTTTEKKGVRATLPEPPRLDGEPQPQPQPEPQPEPEPTPAQPPIATVLSATVTPGVGSALLAWDVTTGTDGATGLRLSRTGRDTTGKFPNGYYEDRGLEAGTLNFRDLVEGDTYEIEAALLPLTLGRSVSFTVKPTASTPPVEPTPEPTPEPDGPPEVAALMAEVAELTQNLAASREERDAAMSALDQARARLAELAALASRPLEV